MFKIVSKEVDTFLSTIFHSVRTFEVLRASPYPGISDHGTL